MGAWGAMVDEVTARGVVDDPLSLAVMAAGSIARQYGFSWPYRWHHLEVYGGDGNPLVVEAALSWLVTW